MVVVGGSVVVVGGSVVVVGGSVVVVGGSVVVVVAGIFKSILQIKLKSPSWQFSIVFHSPRMNPRLGLLLCCTVTHIAGSIGSDRIAGCPVSETIQIIFKHLNKITIHYVT